MFYSTLMLKCWRIPRLRDYRILKVFTTHSLFIRFSLVLHCIIVRKHRGVITHSDQPLEFIVFYLYIIEARGYQSHDTVNFCVNTSDARLLLASPSRTVTAPAAIHGSLLVT